MTEILLIFDGFQYNPSSFLVDSSLPASSCLLLIVPGRQVCGVRDVLLLEVEMVPAGARRYRNLG